MMSRASVGSEQDSVEYAARYIATADQAAVRAYILLSAGYQHQSRIPISSYQALRYVSTVFAAVLGLRKQNLARLVWRLFRHSL